MNKTHVRKIVLLLVFGCFLFTASVEAQDAVQKMNVIQDLYWSPDGSFIYFSSMRVNSDYSDYKPEKWNIFRYERTSKTTKKIIEGAYTVSVSPDGKRLAVGQFVDGNQDIYIADTSGKIEMRLTDHDSADSAPSWSPDGKQIAFNSKRTGKIEIFIINKDGTGLRQLTNSGEHKSFNPSWSPNGKLIAYYLEKGDGKDQIHVIRKDGTGDLNLTDDGFNNIYPGWIGNDKLIYGQADADGKTRAFRVDSKGKVKSQVLELESFYARYSPDNSMIAYVVNKEGVIKIIKADGSELEVVVVPV